MSSALFTGRVPKASFKRIDALLAREPKRVKREVKNALDKWGDDWKKRVQDRFGGPLRGPSDSLRSRRGRLKGTIDYGLSGSELADFKLRCVGGGPLAPYARIQEEGGEVRPKNAKYLTIPTEANLTAAGRPRYPSAREFIASHKGQTWFFRDPRSDTLLLIWRNPTAAARKAIGGKKGLGIPLFRLVRSVEIPGPKAPTKKQPSRLGFFDTWHSLAPERKRDLVLIARGAGRA